MKFIRSSVDFVVTCCSASERECESASDETKGEQIKIENKGFSSQLDYLGEIKGEQLHCSKKSLKHFRDAIVNVEESSMSNTNSAAEENQCIDGTPISESGSQSNFSIREGIIESLILVESSGKESTDSLPVHTIQDNIGLSGFNEDNAQNVEFDMGCSFISAEDASLSCSQTSSSRQIENIDTEDKKNKVCNPLVVNDLGIIVCIAISIPLMKCLTN